jgi:energy-coupling factor transport system ATP-binding protein
MPFIEMHERVEIMLQRFHLTALRRKSPHYLSGGEKQRLALAAVLAMMPDYLVLDEPTSLLDPAGRQDMLAQFRQWHDPAVAQQRTLIMITQFPEEAMAADRLVIMHRGRVVMDDRPEIILQRSLALQSIGLDSPAPYKLQHLLGPLVTAS